MEFFTPSLYCNLHYALFAYIIYSRVNANDIRFYCLYLILEFC
jgi:hypothetical protein